MLEMVSHNWTRWFWLLMAVLLGWQIPWVSMSGMRQYTPDCTTTSIRNGPSSSHGFLHAKKVKCYKPEVLSSVEAVTSKDLPLDTVQLDLSGNTITELPNGSFAMLSKLERLNLAKNQISIISHGAFWGLDYLKLLNLSYNHLRTVDNSTFEGLVKLEKLLLVGNQLSRLSDGTFDSLPALQFLDLMHNRLVCDCHLHWLVNWSQLNDVQVSSRSACQFPPQLRGVRLHKIKPNQWHCDWPLQVPMFELRPFVSQVVFAGDPLKFSCHVSHVESSSSLMWTHNDRQLTSLPSEDYLTDNQLSADGMLLMGSLAVRHLRPKHSGTWTCWLVTAMGNETRSVVVRVLSDSTRYCPQSVTADNKGQYVWPWTVAGIKVELPCGNVAASGRRLLRVTRFCDERGSWEQLDTSKCPYVSEVTKVLEQFAKTNLNITSSSVIESVHRLRNYTGDGSMLTDKMDVVFISRTINKYLDFVPQHREIGEALIDIIATVTHLNGKLLRDAQIEDRACSRLVEAVERLPELIAEGAISRHHNTLAIEEFVVKVDGFQGITCASFIRRAVWSTSSRQRGGTSGAGNSGRSGIPSNASGKKVFRCTANNSSLLHDDDPDEMLETSIQIPASLFLQMNLNRAMSYRLQFAIYHDAALFPRTSKPKYRLDIVSGIIGSNLAKKSVLNLTEPIMVTLRSPGIVGDVVPVWWDFSANGKLGDWSSEGCRIWRIYGNLVTFHCNRLANFGLLQDVNQVALLTRERTGGAPFRLLHPVIYVGSAIGTHCLLAAVITYILGFKLIHVSKKNKHSLINTWLSAALLCLTFSLGVRHTENTKICQGVGLVLHYLSFVCIFWMIITASNTYKKLNRSEPEENPDEPPADYPLPPKPMLRFYLVGWGIPIIICGISGAVNMEEYAGYNYCFLAFTHSVGAFYGPCVALLFLLCIFYLLIHCAVRRLPDDKRGDQFLQDRTDMELVDVGEVVGDRSSVGRSSQRSPKPASDTSSDEDDLEHSPPSQLRAQIVVLLIFLVCWATAAIATAEPFSKQIPLATELTFGLVYAVSVVSLGIFVFTFHCATREDVRLVWKLLYRCRESGIVRETERLPLPTNHAFAGGGPSGSVELGSCLSNDSLSSASYATNKSRSTTRSVDGAAKGRIHCKRSAAEAVALANGGGVTDTSWSGEMFYNPYQNGVARKFFRKHSRHQQHGRGAIKAECPPASSCHQTEDKLAGAATAVVTLTRLGNWEEQNPLERLPSVGATSSAVPNRFNVIARAPPPHTSSVRPDRSTESQLFSSSSQGLVSVSPSQSGNCSEKSLLIVEEEEDEEEDEKEEEGQGEDVGGILNLDIENVPIQSVDWGPCTDQELDQRDATFSPESPVEYTKEDFVNDSEDASEINMGCAVAASYPREEGRPELLDASPNDSSTEAATAAAPLDCVNGRDCSKTWHFKLPQKSGTLPRSSWEKQCQESRKSRQPVYAYAVHSCHQQLCNILADSNGIGVPPKKVTRSASTGGAEFTLLGAAPDRLEENSSLPETKVWKQEQAVKKETAV